MQYWQSYCVLLLLFLAAAVIIQRSTFESNSADYGGAITVCQGPLIQIQDCNFTGNAAVNPITGNPGNGGAVFVFAEGARMLMSTSNFTGNKASVGGVIYIQNATALNMSELQMVDNVAMSWGGALANADDSVGGC